MRLQVEVSEDAGAQIAAAVQWWSEHRPAAPGAVLADLDRALELLSAYPGIGACARNVALAGVRRVTLARIGHHLYYRVAGEILQVLALWHARRGSGPPL